MKKTSRDFLLEILLLSVAVVWGANLSVMKLLYEYFHPVTVSAVRISLAAFTMFLILKARGGRLEFDRRDLPALVGLGVLSNTVYQFCFVLGLERTRAGNVGLLMALTPIFAYLAGGVLKREKFTRRVWIGIGASVLGAMTIVVFGPEDVSFDGTWRGDLLVVIAAGCFGWYTGSSQSLLDRYGSLRFTVLTMIFGASVLVPLSAPWLIRQSWGAIPPLAWTGLVASALLAIVYAYFVWAYAIKSLGAAHTSVVGNLTPVFALLAAWVLVAERPVPIQGLSILLIFAGIHVVRTEASKRATGSGV